jgi:aldehyde:ferredoxin oxidoreductase
MALLISGNREVKSPEHNAYRKTCSMLYDTIVKTGLTEKYIISAQAKISWS